MKKNVKRQSYGFLVPTLIILLSALAGCAADPEYTINRKSVTNQIAAQGNLAAALQSTRVSFQYQDYYSITSPHPISGCAGDAKKYYDPLRLGVNGPLAFEQSYLNPSSTIRPAFLKNISVDLTDTNAPVPNNLALTCSYGTGASAPPVSNCATFDYGAAGGIATNLGGSLLLIGGNSSLNYSGYLPAARQAQFPFKGHSVNCGPVLPAASLTAPVGFNSCPTSVYALSVNSLPATAATDPPNGLVPGLKSASEPISTWANISSAAGYAGPQGLVGASASYDRDLNRLLIFGGASPMGGIVPTGPGISTYDSWAYDLKSLKWNLLNANVYVDLSMITMNDFNASGTGPSILPLGKIEGQRSLFGYVAGQGFALNAMSTNGVTVAPLTNGAPNPNSNIDLTDRVIIVGGTNGTNGLSDTHRFNPTFGPDWVDALGVNGAINAPAAPQGIRPVQWLDSFHTQLMNNSYSQAPDSSLYRPAYPDGTGNRSLAVSFGLVALRNNSSTKGSGYLLGAGGFNFNSLANIANGAVGGGMLLGRKHGPVAGEDATANYMAIPSLMDASFTQYTPIQWRDVSEPGAGGSTVPWYGGSVALPGFNLQTNDVVYFGGADCSRYLNDIAAPCTSFANPGRYWRLSADPNITAAPQTIAFVGTAPTRAGMAAARGTDANGNPLIVAYGGMSAANTANDVAVYFLYNAGSQAAPVPTWGSSTPAVAGPVPYGNASLVFSHITKKFYMFGGYTPNGAVTVGDTWELSVAGNNCGIAGGCTFVWKKLNVANGLTCYPNNTCPAARRSHRMIEVNYFNRNPASEPVCTNPATPCSFGIFMQGGTPDGIATFADRWMFDPTANGGLGHWQKMGDLPPRTLAAMASTSYVSPTTQAKVYRAVMFGGETGLHSPTMGTIGNYFVPPTLGDTFMYDFSNNTWNRVTLLGKGYNVGTPLGSNAGNSITGVLESEARQAYSATDNSITGRALAELSPPPLSGAIMVTRTLSGPSTNTSSIVQPLKIPEVYLLGGRLKDGSFNTLDRVYKFCAGSTGEKPFNVDATNTPRSPSGQAIVGLDDASCDAYDPITNPLSPSPSTAYVGRWLRKIPTGANGTNLAASSSFMGAGAYDSYFDKIILVGGTRNTAIGTPGSITDLANSATSIAPATDPSVYVYEYTPAVSSNPARTQTETQGAMALVRNCTGNGLTNPVGRYGHSLGYDSLNKQLVLVGGYDATGTPLMQNMTYSDGRAYSIPEVWMGKRLDGSNIPSSISAQFPVQNPPLSAANPCYYWKKVTTFGNSLDLQGQAPPQTGISHAASVYIPSSGYNSGYYTTSDRSCVKTGPISSTDSSVNKLLAGGVYIDIDRKILGKDENLLLNLTYIPLGEGNQASDSTLMSRSEEAIFKIHLIKTGQNVDTLQQIFQPRFMTYTVTDQFPQVVQTLSVLSPPTGQIKQDQVLIPISIDSSIDRIRIERYSGSAILIDASIFRMGNP